MAAEAQPGNQLHDEVVLVKHYDLFYWWIVWLYAGAAWLVTQSAGLTIKFGTKDILFYPGPLLGIGFVAVLMFVAIFTSIRARGAMSTIFLLILVVIGGAGYFLGAWQLLIELFPNLRIHMNQAFYGLIFAILFPAWLCTTFIFNRLEYFVLLPNQRIARGRLLGGGRQIIATTALVVRRIDDDIFVHRIMGLAWARLGTGDFEIIFDEIGHGTRSITINNVFRANSLYIRYQNL